VWPGNAYWGPEWACSDGSSFGGLHLLSCTSSATETIINSLSTSESSTVP
jgi:hypothetical protein